MDIVEVNSICTPAISETMGLLAEVQDFLTAANLSPGNSSNKGSKPPTGGAAIDASTLTADLEHYCKELDSCLQSLQLSLQIQS